MIDVIFDSLKDGIKSFIFIFIIYIVFSFFELRIANRLKKKNVWSPLYGAFIGLIPQCGVSVVASDLYLKRHISMGTLIAIFLSCSDEAIPILISDGTKIDSVIPLIVVKFIVGFIAGFIIDLIIVKKTTVEQLQTCQCCNDRVHLGCCNHSIDNENEEWFEIHIWHPFLHSLKLFVYLVIINVIMGSIVYGVGVDKIESVLVANKHISPLLSVFIGLIPNCASSVIITQLYINNGISFGSTLAGLCMNAGLGLIYLFKNTKNTKNNIKILTILMLISLFVGYISCIILGF